MRRAYRFQRQCCHQTGGLNKASRNSQDGISMLQTADAALQETQDVLGRMVELTTQAANDTHTDADRRSIQDELESAESGSRSYRVYEKL